MVFLCGWSLSVRSVEGQEEAEEDDVGGAEDHDAEGEADDMEGGEDESGGGFFFLLSSLPGSTTRTCHDCFDWRLSNRSFIPGQGSCP